jgi:hypothetical protein
VITSENLNSDEITKTDESTNEESGNPLNESKSEVIPIPFEYSNEIDFLSKFEITKDSENSKSPDKYRFESSNLKESKRNESSNKSELTFENDVPNSSDLINLSETIKAIEGNKSFELETNRESIKKLENNEADATPSFVPTIIEDTVNQSEILKSIEGVAGGATEGVGPGLSVPSGVSLRSERIGTVRAGQEGVIEPVHVGRAVTIFDPDHAILVKL